MRALVVAARSSFPVGEQESGCSAAGGRVADFGRVVPCRADAPIMAIATTSAEIRTCKASPHLWSLGRPGGTFFPADELSPDAQITICGALRKETIAALVEVAMAAGAALLVQPRSIAATPVVAAPAPRALPPARKLRRATKRATAVR